MQLSNPANWQVASQLDENPANYEFRLSGVPEDVVRVFYLTHAQSVQDLTEIATVVRAIGDIRRVFTYNSAKALVVRGTAEQAGLAHWLCSGLNNPVNRQDAGGRDDAEVAQEYRLLNTPEDVVRVFYLTAAGPPQFLHDIATQVRPATQVRRLFIHSASKALAMRGTVDQIAIADRLIHERTR